MNLLDRKKLLISVNEEKNRFKWGKKSINSAPLTASSPPFAFFMQKTSLHAPRERNLPTEFLLRKLR